MMTDTIKTDLTKIWCGRVDWIHLAQVWSSGGLL
jgi:hypothetical protein